MSVIERAAESLLEHLLLSTQFPHSAQGHNYSFAGRRGCASPMYLPGAWMLLHLHVFHQPQRIFTLPPAYRMESRIMKGSTGGN